MVAAASWRRARSLFLCRMAMVWDNKLGPGSRARPKKIPRRKVILTAGSTASKILGGFGYKESHTCS